MSYLGWFDSDPKKPVAAKVGEAVQRYQEKFGKNPTLCLLNAKDVVEYQGLEVKVVEYVRPNNFWVGRGEDSNNL